MAKFTDELAKELVKLIEQGRFIDSACKEVGIDSSTFRRWRKRGRDGEEPYASLMLAVDKAEVCAEENIIAYVRAKMGEEWKAAQWMAAKRFPDKYGDRRTNVIEVNQKVESLIDAVEPHMSLGAYDELIRAIAVVQGLDPGEAQESGD